MFFKKCLSSIPIPKPLSPGKGLYYWGYRPSTKQGCLQSATQSHCTMQWHKWLTTCTGATPKARMLWLLAKSFARCKTSRASNARHPFLSTIEIFRLSVISFLCCLPYCNNHRFMVKLCTESFSAVNEIKILHYCKYQTNIRKESI